ncbi:DNA-J related domain-containing protein [Glaciecola sp. KUL10]|uniref:DNA-J related domain-containing protein n=1 Tax=Glaciecola sp. (strain KUL10) TaxID=2161813 RepID=UPI000D816EEF|nr:DNA-J related domain-containing protein [Glaciecola sp. KUL10]GBL03516.1 DnaJ-related protein [Glaciecola sp. KUL10]
MDLEDQKINQSSQANKQHHQTLIVLKEALSDFQQTFKEGISEYELINQLKKPPYCFFDEDALADPLILFQTHFILFHALYLLRNDWRQAQVGELTISALKIQLSGIHAPQSGIAPNDPLADYYLDWRNLLKTNDDDVEKLLTSFWSKMAGIESIEVYSSAQINAALADLSFNSLDGLNRQTLKQQYRKLQHEYHPDKGGTVEQAQTILRAYTILCAVIDV